MSLISPGKSGLVFVCLCLCLCLCACIPVSIHAHACIYAHTHIQTYARARARTHTHTHAHAQTHTYMKTKACASAVKGEQSEARAVHAALPVLTTHVLCSPHMAHARPTPDIHPGQARKLLRMYTDRVHGMPCLDVRVWCASGWGGACVGAIAHPGLCSCPRASGGDACLW